KRGILQCNREFTHCIPLSCARTRALEDRTEWTGGLNDTDGQTSMPSFLKTDYKQERLMNSPRVVCFGELLLRLGAPGNQLLLQTPALDVHAGGAEANVGVSLAHFGHDVAMVSTVADNPLGAAVAGELRRHGVDTSRVQRTDGRMGLYFLTTGAGHRPSEVVYDRADSAFANATGASYDWPVLLQGAQWLHLSGVSPALGQEVAETTLAAARAAVTMGIKVSFDGNFRPKLWEQIGRASCRERVER